MTPEEFECRITEIYQAAFESNLDRLDVYERCLCAFGVVFGQELERWESGGQDSD